MSTLNKVWSEIKKHKSFLIVTHHNPDADAACSALAMAMALKSLGKKTLVLNEDKLPDWLEFLPHSKNFHKKLPTTICDFDLAIVLDCGDFERTGGVAKCIAGKKMINIDHHISNDNFGDINLVFPKASSTCEILFDLFKEAKIKMNKDLAKLLYAGIMTDTGSFRYDNTSAKTHEIIAELMKFKISASDLYQRLYVGIPSKEIKGFIDVIHSAELLFNNKVYCVMLPLKVTNGLSKGFDLKEKIFGFLRSVEGIEVVVIFQELSSRQTRVNLRSQNYMDVAKLASQFNGGGHQRAAGARVDWGLVESKKKILAAVKRSL
ncbi:MAG: bifunctional oligoribonuclease/PAP phosphatase NrnA [Candidatus Omnitrophica bacterium]|nr:bifunctional oligoribonuclease/PAP phosphatase NrnA [Candidatus Omnitrophota bacterium]